MRSLLGIILSIMLITNLYAAVTQVYAGTEPVITFDREVYSPFDLVGMEIAYPPANTDPKEPDRLEARVFTSSGSSQTLSFDEAKPVFGQYKYYEYHTDVGIFHSYVHLTPDPERWRSGLKVQRDDYLIVEFKTKDNRTFTNKVDVNFDLGTVQFNKDAFIFKEKAEIIVWDFDRNNKPNTIETLPVWVWSTTDPHGTMVTLRETNANSGEFRAFITLTTNESSSGTRLRVSDGDTLTARYTDNTPLPTGELSPKGFEMFAVRDVFASALISGPCVLCPPLERMIMDEPQILKRADEIAISATQLDAGDTAIIRTEITNTRKIDEQFAYITQVKDSDNVVVSLSWIRGELKLNETMKAESTWIPEFPGTYYIEIFLWSDVDRPEALSPVRITEVEVR